MQLRIGLNIFAVSDDGILTMASKSDKEWTDYVGGSKSAGADRITVHIPDTVLSSLTLHTTKEDISLPALTVTDQLRLSANGGDIFFENISTANAITVENKNGNITGTIVGSYDDYAITCAVKKGESNLPKEKAGGSKTLTAINNNGDIDIEIIKEPKCANLKIVRITGRNGRRKRWRFLDAPVIMDPIKTRRL